MAEATWDTPTMAELYVAQGHLDQALDLYRRLVQQTPGDPALAERLAQLEQQANATQGEMMGFREPLQAIVDAVPGTISAIIMGFDGIPIDSCDPGAEGADIPALLTSYLAPAQELRHAHTLSPEVGHLSDLTIRTSEHTCVIWPLTDEYFVAAVLKPGALVGKARFRLRLAAIPLLKELT